jgi:microcystin-dependent protein
MEPYIGQIQTFGFNFAPRGWALCNGQIMSIAQNTALFSLLGTTYGGNGQTTFALPDLRGRFPVHQGQGPGLSPYQLGQISGTETTTLIATNLPAHTHTFQLQAAEEGTSETPQGNYIAGSGANGFAAAPNVAMANTNVGITGNNQPFSILNPYLCINFCIALEGIFPSRN